MFRQFIANNGGIRGHYSLVLLFPSWILFFASLLVGWHVIGDACNKPAFNPVLWMVVYNLSGMIHAGVITVSRLNGPVDGLRCWHVVLFAIFGCCSIIWAVVGLMLAHHSHCTAHELWYIFAEIACQVAAVPYLIWVAYTLSSL